MRCGGRRGRVSNIRTGQRGLVTAQRDSTVPKRAGSCKGARDIINAVELEPCSAALGGLSNFSCFLLWVVFPALRTRRRREVEEEACPTRLALVVNGVHVAFPRPAHHLALGGESEAGLLGPWRPDHVAGGYGGGRRRRRLERSASSPAGLVVWEAPSPGREVAAKVTLTIRFAPGTKPLSPRPREEQALSRCPPWCPRPSPPLAANHIIIPRRNA